MTLNGVNYAYILGFHYIHFTYYLGSTLLCTTTYLNDISMFLFYDVVTLVMSEFSVKFVATSDEKL